VTFYQTLEEADSEVFNFIQQEKSRQNNTLEMIASENFVPLSIMEAQGSVLTNKYAEGYPGKRYYGGCEFVDEIENLAISRVKQLFGAKYANVQPHSGSSASAAVLHALASPGDTILGMELSHGGHLTHGMKLNFSGRNYKATSYGVDPLTNLIDMDEVRDKALEHRPQVLIAGWSAYSRHLDFDAFRSIANEVGAKLWVDMAHFSGLVAADLHPSPFPFADAVSTTVHKTLGGPRSGVILSQDADIAKRINSAVFPGQQGGPLMHVIAAKAVAFKLAMLPEFKERQERTISGAKVIAETLVDRGINVLTGGTDVHLLIVDLSNSSISGKEAEDLLHSSGITVNRNSVPFDSRSPMITSGLRIGTPALATRGFGDEEFQEVADVIADLLLSQMSPNSARDRVKTLTQAFKLY
jgi:glycine hydroxymethyltransferase